MRVLTYAEFFAEPEGVIFSQATGLPHQFSYGLFRKGQSWPESDDDSEGVTVVDLLLRDEDTGSPSIADEFLESWTVEEDARFFVFEEADLDWLASAIGRGRP